MSVPLTGNLNEPVAVYIYDCSIPLEERKDKRKEFSSIRKAQDYLGISKKQAERAVHMQTRVFSPLWGKEFAVRVKPTK